MKKLSAILFFVLSCATFSLPAKASSNANGTMTPQQQERMNEIAERVNEIKNMDKTSLTKEDKAELRQELKQMNHETRIIRRRGVAILVALLVVIIVLLVILI